MEASAMSFEATSRRVREFSRVRDWEQFQTPKNLAMAIAAEAGELLAEFQWLTATESEAASTEGPLQDRVISEIADVGIFLLRLCDVIGVDLNRSVIAKLRENEDRFPIGLVKSRALRGRDVFEEQP